jgi:hypothetical protein
MRSAVKPPETTIFTRSKPSRSSASRTLRTSRSLTPRGSKSPISSQSDRSTSWPEVSSRTPQSLGPSSRATSSAVLTESFSKSTRTVMFMSGSAFSANFVAARTVLPPYEPISACGTVPTPRPPHQDACASDVTPISAPTIWPAM